MNALRVLRVAAPSIRIVPWTALASCWPLPQQLLPVSATGGGRRRCWAFLAERLFLILGQRSVCGRSAVPFSREGRCEDGHLPLRRGLKKAQKRPQAPLSLLLYNDWITSGRSVLPPRPCGWPSWWRYAPRCGCRRTSPRSRTLPCLPAQPAGRFPAQGRSGSWENP